MKFYKAEIADILRLSQRDASFINELQDYVVDAMRFLCGKKYNIVRQYVPVFTSSWYYLLTSVSNVQTLGEEYTGTIRICDSDIPSVYTQLIWMAFYLGGDKLFDKFLTKFGKEVNSSESLRPEAKSSILKVVDFVKEHKYIILRLHHSIFYICGTYYNISNRLTGVQYVLLRQWMQDTSAAASFNILGKISMLYLLLLLAEKVATNRNSTLQQQSSRGSNKSAKVCALCVENCKNVSATPCGHMFCWECIYDCLKHQPSCPVCRETVNPSRIVLLQNYS